MNLPIQIATALTMLSRAGYEAFIVGGCVRDFLLGGAPDDYDITTSALPAETEAVFSSYRVIETGISHGTVTVLIDGMPIEITTYRVDGGYSDSRHPDSVRFTRSLREDAARRDFTMNAIAYNPDVGLRDYFGGEQDIQGRVIRCVGNPDTRFREDALRILRAVRFSSVLGFDIDGQTRAALFRESARLSNVSAERIATELIKLLCGGDAARVLTEYIDVLGVIIPELLPCRGFDQKNRHHIYDVLTHTAHVVENVSPTPVLRLAALLHDIGKPQSFTEDEHGEGHFYGHAAISTQLASDILTRLKLDNATRDTVLRLVKLHDEQIEESERAVKRAMSRLTPELFFLFLELARADNLAQSAEYRDRQRHCDVLYAIAQDILRRGECLSLRDLAANGDDIIALGIKPGRAVGALLNALLDGVIAGEVKNEKDALIVYARRRLSDFM